MGTKKILITFIILSLLPTGACLAGDTTISGTASCIMPELIGYNTPAPAMTPNAKKQADELEAAPIPLGASGNYEVQKEEKLIQTEKTTVADKGTEKEKNVTVYTICAK